MQHGERNWSTWSTSGLIFIVAFPRSEDYLATSGSVVWTIACLLWFIPVLLRRNSQDQRIPNRSFLLFLFSQIGLYGIVHCFQPRRGLGQWAYLKRIERHQLNQREFFCYTCCWVGCQLMASTEEKEGSFNLILTVFFFFQPKYELNCQLLNQ